MRIRYKSLPFKFRASFWFLVCSFLQKGMQALTTPIFTRLLTPEEYGQYTVFNSWMGIVSLVVGFSLTGGMYAKSLVQYSDQRAVLSSSMQGLSLTLCTGWTVIYLLFHRFWNTLFSLTTVQMLAMLVMIWASAAFGFWASEQRVEYRYQKLVTLTLAASVAKPLLSLVFVLHAQDKVTAWILGMTLAELVAYTGLFFVQMRRGKVFFSARFWKHALLFNLPLLPHYLSQIVLSSADRIMIKNMVGDSAAGIYGLAYSISLVMTLFNSALGQTLSPWIYQKIKDRKEKDIARVAYLSLLLIAGVNLVLIVFAPEVIAIFAPPSYHAAIWVVPPVAMSALFIFSYDLFAKFEFYYERTKFIMLASVAGAALNVLLNAIFISRYGYYAAGYTTLVCYIVYALAHYLSMRKICKTYLDGIQVYDPKRLLAIYVAFLACGFALLATYDHPVLRYGIAATALLLAFVRRRSLWKTLQTLLSLRK